MSIDRDYLLSFFLSLAFWISILFVFNLSLKTPEEESPTIIILKAPKLVEQETEAVPKPVEKPHNAIEKSKPIKPLSKPIQKPVQKQVQKPVEKPVQSTSEPAPSQNIEAPQNTSTSTQTPLNLPSKAPSNVPSLPAKAPQKSAGGDYFKNAYTPPKALYHPKPHIPQSLLPDVKEIVLKVKFYIGKDGSARAVLLNPTPNPHLNAILQKELSEWKFFPATKDQKPVDSTLDMEIKIRIE